MTLILEPLKLETRARWQIPNYQRLEQTPTRLSVAKDIILKSHPTAKVRSLTGVYNCYGMVFANRRTCVDGDVPSNIERILKDDGYRLLKNTEMPEAGDIVVYKDGGDKICHVALVVYVSSEINPAIRVLSQWGADGEYSHLVADVSAYLGVPKQYWTDRMK